MGSALSPATIAELAERLDQAQQERSELAPLTVEYTELSAEDGYAIQQRLVALRMARGGTLIGMKTGLTSQAKQEAMGVHEPIFGHLCSDMLLPPGEPLRVAELIHPRAEPEIAFILGRDLQGPGATAEEALEAAAAVVPALEIIDSRYRAFQFTLADVVADNASAGRAALGTGRRSPVGLDLAKVRVRLERNGEPLDQGLGSDVLGHPAAAVAWLANAIAPYGLSLKAGDLVLPGALCNAYAIAAGDEICATFDGLGKVRLSCR